MTKSSRASTPVYPVFLRLEGRLVAVVGGGAVAERKVASLLEAGARVRVIAPRVTPRLSRLASDEEIAWTRRAFRASDLDDAWFCVACTSSARVQATVYRASVARRVFCLAVDDVARASAFGGSVIRRPPFVVAISSSGEAPALTRLVRMVVEDVLPDESLVETARALRAKWKRDGVPVERRFVELARAVVSSEEGSRTSR